MTTIRAVSYEQSRLEYFLEQIQKLQKDLAYYSLKMDKLGSHASSHQIMDLQDKVSEIGMKTSFYQDAIRVFGVHQ